MFKLFRRRSPRGKPVSAWPNVVLGGLLLAAVSTAAAAPDPAGRADRPELTAGATAAAVPPVVSSLAPSTGVMIGGTSVVITGAGFTGATAVSFGGTPATSFTIDGPTQITAVAPAHIAGPATVLVSIGSCTSSIIGTAFTYTLPILPPIAELATPATGPAAGGTTVTVTGTNLTGTTSVTFDGVAGTSLNVLSSASLTVASPAGTPGLVALVATGPDGSTTVPGGFTYLPAVPTATSLTPTGGPFMDMTLVTITGTNLTGTTSVTFGGFPATGLTVNSPTSVTVSAPVGPIGNAAVVVTAPGGVATVPGGFTYLMPVDGETATQAATTADTEPATTAEAVTATPAMKLVRQERRIESGCVSAPGAPTNVVAVAGTSALQVTWTPSVANGSPVTGYTVTATPGPATCTTLVTDPAPTRCVLGGTAGTAYTVAVIADSEAGASPPGAGQAAVTPSAPVVPTSPPDTPLTLTTDQGHITTAVPGQDIVVIGNGFAAYSTATITLYSTPLTLGTVVTDGNGNFSKPVTVPADLAAGVHAMVAQGVAPSGNPRAMKLTVTVAADGTGSALPVTGSPAATVAGTGLALLLTGAVMLHLSRTRRRYLDLLPPNVA